MKMPKGTIFVNVVLSVCILVLGAGAGAAGAPPSDGNNPAVQVVGHQENAGGQGAPGLAGPDGRGSSGNDRNITRMDNRTPIDFNATRPFGGTFPDHGNMTFPDNQTPIYSGSTIIPFNSTSPRLGGMMDKDNRTPVDDNNATQPSGNQPPGNRNTGQQTGGQGSGTNAGQQYSIDELIEALTRFFNKSS